MKGGTVRRAGGGKVENVNFKLHSRPEYEVIRGRY